MARIVAREVELLNFLLESKKDDAWSGSKSAVSMRVVIVNVAVR